MEKSLLLLPLAAPLFFVGLCLTISHLLSRLSGWRRLAGRWANPVAPEASPSYRSGPASGSLGSVKYNHALWYELYPEALRLGVYFPLRGGHCTLMIPRDQIAEVAVETHWFGYFRVSMVVDGLTLRLLTRNPSILKDWAA